MKNNKKRSNKGILLALLLVLGISVGYAVLTTTLKINGSTTVKSASWNIHFGTIGTPSSTGNPTVVQAPQLVQAPPTGIDEEIEFSVTLNKPGDTYSFSVPVENDGTLAAKISNSTIFTISAEDSDSVTVPSSTYDDYFTYSVVWHDTNATPAQDDQIAGSSSRTIDVTVAYRTDIDAADLPDKDVTFTMDLLMTWVQA